MSDTFEHNKPYSITFLIGDSLSNSALTAPYDLHFLFDPVAVADNTTYLALDGFDSSAFGGVSINNKDNYLLLTGFSTNQFGVTRIQNQTQYIYAASVVGFRDGLTTLENKARVIGAIGWEATQHSTHDIENTARQIFAGLGGSTLVFGDDLSVINKNSYVNLSGIDSKSFGMSTISHYRRVLYQSGNSSDAYGTPSVEFYVRSISPSGVNTSAVSIPSIGRPRVIGAIGFDATLFGTRIIPEIQAVYLNGFSGAIGQANIKNRLSVISAKGFFTGGQQSADRWGRAKAYNLRQYIMMYYQEDSGLYPPPWSKWQKIENRNRVVTTFGQNASKVSEPSITNNARLIAPLGITSPTDPPYYKAGMVSHRVRNLQLQGIEPHYIASWSIVYNNARVINAKGSMLSAFGVTNIVKTRRYFDHIGGFNASAFGQPLIAYRVRNISFESRYTITPPSIKLPVIKLYRRYIDGIGHDLSRFGAPSLTIHKNIITPRWTLKNHLGSPAVKNNTPEIHLFGHNSADFGTSKVRLQWRPLVAKGSSTQIFGSAETAYRDRIRFLKGFNAGVVGDKLIIANIFTPPYASQRIDVFGFPEDMLSRFGKPSINQQVLYVSQQSAFTKFGTLSITANSIRVEPGYQELLVGKPSLSLKIRTIGVKGWAEDSTPTKARLSPNTIWAVMEAPEQAQSNNPAIGELHYVNSGGGSRSAGEVFGVATISGTGARFIRPTSINGSSYGQSSLELKRRYIEPSGIRSLRLGWIEIPGNETLEQFESVDSMDFGQSEVGFSPYLGPQSLYMSGLDLFIAGNALIETRDRTIKPIGHNSMVMGESLNGDTPYMWQGLRIGPRVPIVANGSDMSHFGLTWISNRVRGIGAEGFDSFRCEYQLEAFRDRMKVTRRVIPTVARQITPVGISAFNSGTPNVKAGTQYIRPDGNSDQYRKGAF